MPATMPGSNRLVLSDARRSKRSNAARPMTAPSLANSLGWISKPGSEYHRREPLMTEPNNGSPSNDKTAPP